MMVAWVASEGDVIWWDGAVVEGLKAIKHRDVLLHCRPR